LFARGDFLSRDIDIRKFHESGVKRSVGGEFAPKPPKRKLYTWLFFVFIFIVIGAYIAGYIYTHMTGDGVELMRVEMGYAVPQAAFDGVIVRDEVVYSGILLPAFDEHQRVRGGQMLASGVYAQSAGTVSGLTDGFEGLLSPQGITAVTRDIIADVQNAEFTQGIRVVTSNDWYIAAYMPADYARNLRAGLTMTIFVHISDEDDKLPLAVMVERLQQRVDDYFIVFTTNAEMLRFIDERGIVFSISQNPVEGYKIPRTALVERSVFPVPREFVTDRYLGTNTVEIGDGRRVPVGGWFDGDYFLILADGGYLRANDVILVTIDESDETLVQIESKTYTLDRIEVVTGVFQVNMGFTTFRTVVLPENYSRDDEYIVLNPAENPFLRLFDWIAKDARNVDNRLLLN